MAFATVNGRSVQELRLTMPMYGVWIADIKSNEAFSADTSTVSVTIGQGFTLAGSVFRFGDFGGTAGLRIVGGAGGWMQRLKAKAYQSSFGVKLRPVLTDAAREVGETVQVDTDRSLGQFFTREACPAGRLLWQTGKTWWMRPDGVTQVGTRPALVVVSQFDVLPETSPLQGRVMIATDTPEDWLPGVKFSAPTLTTQQTVSLIVHRIEGGKFRTEVWTQS